MTDNERIAEYLEQHGSITSYEIRVLELSGNPSQRITELTDAGYRIDTERYTRDVHGKKRPCCRYTLIASPELRPVTKPLGVDGVESSAGGSVASRGSSSGSMETSPCRAAAAISGRDHQAAPAGGDGPSSAVTALPTLFAPDDFVRSVSRYGQDAA